MTKKILNSLDWIELHLTNPISSRILFLVLLILPFMIPQVFENLSGMAEKIVDIVSLCWKFVSASIILIMYLSAKKITAPIWVVSIMECYFIVVTLFTSKLIWNALASGVSIIAFTMLVDLLCRKNFNSLLDVLFLIFAAWTILNIIFLFFFPNGLYLHDYYGYPGNFLGIDNQLAPILFPAAFIFLFRSYYYYHRYNASSVLLCLLVIATFLKVWPATAIMGMIIILVWFLFFQIFKKFRDKITKFVNILSTSILAIVLFLSIVVFRLQDSFAFLIEDILHKDITFTGRTEIWDLAFQKISQCWLFGLGAYDKGGWIAWKRGLMWHAHDTYLNLILQAGVLFLLLYIVFFVLGGIGVFQKKNHPLAILITGFLFSFFIMFIVEVYGAPQFLFTIVLFGYYIKNIIDKSEREKNHSPIRIWLDKFSGKRSLNA
ncbi:MAG: O-antigen ligase family protein [Oscillospiraceae bacterium]|jgi:O-antigen ligase